MSTNGGPRPDNHVIVLFGATGDLAKRKLLPGLFHLHAAGLLPKEYRNILAFRFANGLFEPTWNRQHIRYVQIDVPEKLSIEGRAAFYDATGAYRDMIVAHLLQMLGLVAMEPPVSLSAKSLRDDKVEVFQTLKPLDVRHVVRGRYDGYRSEPGVAPDSQTETMVALRAEVDNWRWHGAPFYLRSGKAMGASRQVITFGFHQPPIRMFPVRRTCWSAG
jgi:glucose-6-phosphate 1-dehydrogenase